MMRTYESYEDKRCQAMIRATRIRQRLGLHTSEFVACRLTQCIVALTGFASFAVVLDTSLSMHLEGLTNDWEFKPSIRKPVPSHTITRDSKTAVKEMPLEFTI